MKGLIIYGEPSVGKSTLDMNLRQYYFGNALTEEQFQFDGTRCFLGKTAKRNGILMATGGAEALTSLEGIPEADWYVAAIPVSGRYGTKLAKEFMLSHLDTVYAVCLHTKNRAEYRNNRTRFFSGKDSIMDDTRPANVRIPKGVPAENCWKFSTEDMLKAFQDSVGLLGPMHGHTPERFFLLEEFAVYDVCHASCSEGR